MQNVFLFRNKFHDFAQVNHKEQNLILILELIIVIITCKNGRFLRLTVFVIPHFPFEAIVKRFVPPELPIFFLAVLVQIPAVNKFFNHTVIGRGIDDAAVNVGTYQGKIAQVPHDIIHAHYGAAFPQFLKNLPFLRLELFQAIHFPAINYLGLRLEFQYAGELQAAAKHDLQSLVNNAFRTDGDESVFVDTVGFINDVLV